MTEQLDALTAQIAAQQEQLEKLTQRLDDLDDLIVGGTPDTATPPRVTTPLYETVHAWVDGHFLPTYHRPLGGEYRWCCQWQDHPEALIRLEALWRTWEAHRLDPTTGIATWLRDHLDHQLPILMGPRGPFAQCTPERHAPANPGAAVTRSPRLRS